MIKPVYDRLCLSVLCSATGVIGIELITVINGSPISTSGGPKNSRDVK